MQNVEQNTTVDNNKKLLDKVNVKHGIEKSSTPNSANSSPVKTEKNTFNQQSRFMSDSSESEDDSVSEVESFIIDRTELDEDSALEKSKFLLSPEEGDRTVDPETQARFEALLHAAGNDPEVLRRLTSSVSCALDEAAAALTRMRTDNPRASHSDKTSLVEACTDGDVGTVRKLLTEGRSVHETTEEGESLLSLACSAGYFELAQVLLAMHANVEDRGIKGECTPLMEAASAGHLDIVRLLIAHGADVNAQSTSGNTPLMYACAGGHEEAVEILLEAGANVEDHNENGHTPLMEAASAGHVNVAKILLRHGAGINTHSNEFKESALTLACYKGHLDMVRFLLEAGADQEHKTDEMHTALMEASMDGHVEVARLLLDSGAQVNMPTDSFESPLTLAACGGHVDLAMLLIERGANIEEVNDEGYTPLMEAAREGHEEMVALLLSQGANINAQTDETQETALTLACCGGFSEVADFLIKAGADIELGASTPLMEAAQEGHLELVRYLLQSDANVHAQTQTGDTALTYACENGHTDVAELLLAFDADLEHESEGGRTPLMKACRAGHLCTVQFLISKGANVNRQTTNNDHTPLSLACAGGHLTVVELLLSHSADPFHKLKDNSTMLIEAAKGGHTNVVQLLLDYPHSIMMASSHPQQAGNVVGSMLQSNLQSMASGLVPVSSQNLVQTHQGVPTTTTAESLSCAGLHEVPEAVRIVAQEEGVCSDKATSTNAAKIMEQFMQQQQPKHSTNQKSLLRKNRSSNMMFDGSLTSAEAQQVRSQPLADLNNDLTLSAAAIELLSKDDGSILDKGSTGTGSIVEYIKARKNKFFNLEDDIQKSDEHNLEKQQILDEIHKVERELQVKTTNHMLVNTYGMNQESSSSSIPPVSLSPSSLLPGVLNLDLTSHTLAASQGLVCGGMPMGALFGQTQPSSIQNAFYTGNKQQQLTTGDTGTSIKAATPFSPISTNAFEPAADGTTCMVTLPSLPIQQQAQNQNQQQQGQQQQTKANWTQQQTTQTIATSPAEVSQSTAISDRPKAKPVSKKEGKNIRKQLAYQQALQQHQQHLQQINQQLKQQVLQQQAQLDQLDQAQELLQTSRPGQTGVVLATPIMTQILEPSLKNQRNTLQPGDTTDLVSLLSEQENCQLFSTDDKKLENVDTLDSPSVDDVQTLETFSLEDVASAAQLSDSEKLQIATQVSLQANQPFPTNLDDAINAITAAHNTPMQVGQTQTDVVRNYQDLQAQHSGLQFQYEQYLQSVAGNDQVHTTNVPSHLPTDVGAMYQAGFQAGIQLCQEMHMSKTSHVSCASNVPETLTTQIPTTPSQSQVITVNNVNNTQFNQQPTCTTHQVQVATQTQNITSQNENTKKNKSPSDIIKVKKGRLLMQRQQPNHVASIQNGQFSNNQNFQIDPNATVNPNYNYQNTNLPQTSFSCMDVDSETDSNHDTALTLACAGGHEDLVELLLSRGADIEHRDKKGFTPLILAATAGHEKVVEILLNHGADIEAQSERTKDTPLSLACSGGRYEVVELLLSRNANREHRNVSDYTPLSLAASGGYVNIIKLLLNHGAEINSRTGSKLGISPLMLAAMNGHTAAVKLLLDMGSDINAQIETNRNTALTLACFQGRHEVVSLLLDRRANVEHRAKTGLTPLMEAASGGYVEVGRVLLDKGADVNATPVPSSRDTALTIAADKGHCRFVELLLCRGAAVEVKNKKGNSPLWLAANGGHLSVVELLYNSGADIDSQDNRKVSCLMAAFRKGHTKVVKWMVNHVTQFPSDQEMIRFIQTISDKELLEKCQECIKIIRAAKETQAAKANKNATILLEELDKEKTREESKKAAAARRRERKKKKKLEKKEEKRKLYEENKKNENYDDKDSKKSESEKGAEDFEEASGDNTESPISREPQEEGDSGIDANSQGSCSSNDVKSKEKRKDKKKKKSPKPDDTESSKSSSTVRSESTPKEITQKETKGRDKESPETQKSNNRNNNRKGILVFESTRHQTGTEEFLETTTSTENFTKPKPTNKFHENEPTTTKTNSTSPKGTKTREEGWKEVVRKSSVQTVQESGSKKVSVPLNAISRVIGRGGSNINAIRGATGAHIEVEKQSKGQGERIITIKGSPEASKQAHMLIAALIKDPDVDIFSMLPRTTKTVTSSLWDKTNAALMAKKNVKTVSSVATQSFVVSTQQTVTKAATAVSVNRTPVKVVTSFVASSTRGTAPRLVAATEKRVQAQIGAQTKNTMSYTTAIMTAGRGATKVVSTTPQQTFAAKLTETNAPSVVPTSQAMVINKTRTSHQNLAVPQISSAPTSPSSSNSLSMTTCTSISSPKHSRPQPTASAPPSIHNYHQIPGKAPFSNTNSNPATSEVVNSAPVSTPIVQNQITSSTNSTVQNFPETNTNPIPTSTTQEYSLFNDNFTKVAQQSMWGRENEKPNFAAATGAGITAQSTPITPQKLIEPPLVVDASKAPGYRGNQTCSPVSSKTSSNSTTPPSLQPLAPGMNYQNFEKPPVAQQINAIGPISRPLSRPGGLEMHSNQVSANSLDLATNHFVNRHIYSNSDIIRPPGEPIYKSASSGNFQEGSNLLKMVPDGQNLMYTNSVHHMTYSQPCQGTNTTVSMSRLNPRAPDFSLIKTPQVPMYNNFNQVYQNQGASSSNPNPNQNPNQVLGNNVPYPLKSSIGNFQQPSRSAQNRWPYMPPSNFQNQDMMVQMPIRNLNHPPGPMDLLENGMCPPNVNINTPPNMSPNSIPNLVNPNPSDGMSMSKLDESRKIPQPIGTERASWKIQNSNLPNTDPTDVNWILGNESKLAMAGWNNAINGPAINLVEPQRQQQPQQYYRTSFRIQGDELPHIIDYQHGGTQLESQHGFQNGAVPPMSLVGPPTLLPQQYPGGLVAQDLIQPDPMKMDMPNWDANPRLNPVPDMQDKQHNWKWN